LIESTSTKDDGVVSILPTETKVNSASKPYQWRQDICCVSVSSLVYCWVELLQSQRYSAVGFLQESWDTIFCSFHDCVKVLLSKYSLATKWKLFEWRNVCWNGIDALFEATSWGAWDSIDGIEYNLWYCVGTT
jgi:hypothetical protein